MYIDLRPANRAGSAEQSLQDGFCERVRQRTTREVNTLGVQGEASCASRNASAQASITGAVGGEGW